MGGSDGRFVLDDLTDEQAQRIKAKKVSEDKEFQAFIVEKLRDGQKVYVGADALFKAARGAGLKGESRYWRTKLVEYAQSPAIPVERDERRGFFHRDRVEAKAS